jgi:gluconate 2-dehydrogenase alpha chain
MATKLEPVEVLLVGFGWTAAIIGKELTDAGMQVLALERGGFRDTVPDFAIPQIQDELRYAVRHEMFQEPARQTITFRNDRSQEALPMRKLGSFNPGTGVGGAGVHWNGQHWRCLPSDFRQKSHVEERYGKGFIPDGMTIQDWGVTYEELEPHFDRFEYLCGTSGAAGNLNGEKQDGGNPFEGARSRDYPNPPLKRSFATEKFDKAAREVGFNPFPCPASNTSRPYTNPLGVQMGACTYCGYCEWFGCGNYSKSTPQTTILPVLLRRDNFSYRTGCNVTRVNLDSSGRRATGVTYVDTEGEEYEQPADLVVLCAYATHNVHLLLLSGIGEAYDPATGTGTLGRNYAYQMMSGVELFFDDNLNPFMGAGALGQAIDDFNGDNFDHGPHGFIGGAYIALWTTGGRPILQHQLPEDTPGWGSKWKQAMADNYLRSTSLSVHGSVMSYEDAYLDLDPTSRAMTEGVAPGGVHLYPAFPYPFFTRVRPEDLQDIKAYLDTLEPVRQEKKENELPWPLSWRTMLVGWNQLFFDEGVYQPDPEKTEEWNRGAYLVEGLGHCSACHSPKNLSGAVDNDEAFKGGFGETWFAPDLSGDLLQGLAEWSIEDLIE